MTQFMTGKKEHPRMEPMHSGGDREVYPITTGYNSVDYTNFIVNHIRNS